MSATPALAADINSIQAPDKELERALIAGAARAADQHAVTTTGSYVDHVTRQYSTEGPFLSVKVSGGRLSVGLTYEHGSWLIGPTRSGIKEFPVERSGLTFSDIGDEETLDWCSLMKNIERG
ncbi:MAG: hypothetical protein GY794_05745 [bacterium]|nr:hypothetical protein [bacterium]